MTEQRRRLERALRGCAERGVPETSDPWPAIKERISGERVSEDPASAEREQTGPASSGTQRRRPRFPRLVPNTPLGWILAVISVLVIGTGAYVASGPGGRGVFDQGLPGVVEPGSKKTGRDAPRDNRKVGSTPQTGQTQVADNVKVTLNHVYADAKFITISYTVQDLKRDRNIDGHPSELTPVQIDDTDRGPEAEKAELPPRVNLTDEIGQDFDLVGGSTSHSGSAAEIREPKKHLAVFAPSTGSELVGKRRLSFKVVFEEAGIFLPGENSAPGNPNPNVGPFSFDIEVPVRQVPTIQVGEKHTTKGITLTLERVVNSPARPQAVFCFDPPDDDHAWTPWLAATDSAPESEAMSPQRVNDGCWSLTLAEPIQGNSSVTVSELMGIPRDPSNPRKGPTTIRGPWTFEFEAPGR